MGRPGFGLSPQKLDEFHGDFIAKYETAFKLEVVKNFLTGDGGTRLLARRWSVSGKRARTLVTHYRLHGIDSLRPI